MHGSYFCYEQLIVFYSKERSENFMKHKTPYKFKNFATTLSFQRYTFCGKELSNNKKLLITVWICPGKSQLSLLVWIFNYYTYAQNQFKSKKKFVEVPSQLELPKNFRGLKWTTKFLKKKRKYFLAVPNNFLGYGRHLLWAFLSISGLNIVSSALKIFFCLHILNKKIQCLMR